MTPAALRELTAAVDEDLSLFIPTLFPLWHYIGIILMNLTQVSHNSIALVLRDYILNCALNPTKEK